MKERVQKIKNLADELTNSVGSSIKTINVLLIISILILLFIYYNHYNRKQENYFAKSIVGNTLPMSALGKFNVSPRSLLNWAMVATTNAFTMDFENYPKILDRISSFFTKTGFDNFKISLDSSGRLSEIIDKKLITSAVVVDYPVIVAEGMQGNNYLWKIQLPIAVTFQGAIEDTYQQWLVVTLIIKKVPNKELKQGIGIENMSSEKIAPMY